MTLPTFSFFGSCIQGCIVVLRQLTRHEGGVSDMHVVSHGKTEIKSKNRACHGLKNGCYKCCGLVIR